MRATLEALSKGTVRPVYVLGGNEWLLVSRCMNAVRTAVVNKRAGGAGLIVGRKAFQRPTDEGAALIHAIQDVYLDESVTIA